VRRALLVLLALALLVGCGSSDENAAEQTVKDFVKATNEGDGDKFCGELVTKDFLKRTTGGTGKKAEDECKAQLRSYRGLNIRLLRIERTQVQGGRAKVTATLRNQGQTQVQVLRLKKEDGRFRLAGGSSG
jgi:hypothetical protein